VREARSLDQPRPQGKPARPQEGSSREENSCVRELLGGILENDAIVWGFDDQVDPTLGAGLRAARDT
jgi:hypothetical protein